MKPIVAILMSIVLSLALVVAAWFALVQPRLALKADLDSQIQRLTVADSVLVKQATEANQEALAELKTYLEDDLFGNLSNRVNAQSHQLSSLRLDYSGLARRVGQLDSSQQVLAEVVMDSLTVFHRNLSSSFSLSQDRLEQQIGRLAGNDASINTRIDRTENFLQEQVIPRLNTPLRFLGFDVFKGSAKLPLLKETETENPQPEEPKTTARTD
jgi:hypothetical protein